MSLNAKAASLTVLLSCGVYSLSAVSAPASEIISVHPPTAIAHQPVEPEPLEPEKVYVETGQATYRGTRSDEYCFYNEEHDHIHCYDQDPGQLQDRVVYEENRTYRSTRYRSTPYRSTPYRSSRYRQPDPIATGIGVGVAIGLPIIVHHAIHDRSYYRSGYRSGYRYGNHHFRQDFRKDFRKDFAYGNRYDRHGRYDKHDRSRKHRVKFR